MMEYSRESVLAAYQDNQSLRAACAATGCPPYVAYIWVKKAGLLSMKDKTSYGTSASRSGAEAEKEFLRLVPYAMPANRVLDSSCPAFDFDVGGMTVDVKYSSLRGNGWGFKTAKHKPMQPDFYCCFFAKDQSGHLASGYHLLLIPHDVIGTQLNITLRPESKSELWQFEVSPPDLAKILSGES